MSETLSYLPTEADQILITRASAHAAAPLTLAPAARWDAWGVDDIEAARVLLALERGTEIQYLGKRRWAAPIGSPLNRRSVGTVVNEMIRVGLLINWPVDKLIPAKVHLKDWDDAQGWSRSKCRVPQEGRGPLRTRLVLDPIMVDCLACLDRL
jgi:hypothetical protein